MSFVSQPVSFLFHPNSHALQVVLCQINIFLSDLRRTICVNLLKSDANQLFYFGLIVDKIC